MDLLSVALATAIILVSVSIHEAAHAWTADRLGDPTARLLGRVSLNPIVHLDPIGSILLPAITSMSGMLFGWAKPVPVNISRLRNGRQGFMLVAAAGPLSNIAQAMAAAVVLRVIDGNEGGLFPAILLLYVRANLFLAFFNLVPIPPLDGGNVLAGVLPPAAARVFDMLRQFGFVIVLVLVLTGVLSELIGPPTAFMLRILLP